MRVLSVNVGRITELQVGTQTYLTAIGKRPVSGPVGVAALGLVGDEQADPTVHGGPGKAVYAYPAEHLPFWRELRRTHQVSLFDEALPPGFMGENLSIEGLLEQEVWIGDEWVLPDCVLRVTAPREPCFKFNAVMGLRDAGRHMLAQSRCGWYLAVRRSGSVEAGQSFTVRPGVRGLSVAVALGAQRSAGWR